ncbi:flagellar hook-basal body complex protein FliE [Candidatus Kryptonium thompsonii]|jgi:flagellar hook-basal body complex protein FliE|uniref:Flagellar hook-basal body complex protein FliE n=1 Tax=Candidatus Kryptonium thompsonii TaxID=1633631 RepID=A0A0P1L7R6_9BACT|nr:flagellar hook-basal body complex protein FliE [Candidatus Kryptonium thompsoni]CUS76858.1 flagellar hook-basal body complex protein FliE [Candidatus Kryptonium thompsoni]CUS77145.1 flagellar hook-basal body complex protein FliE [Candidatus Kryptonium thompsoni]CUS79192.1 flagellar hook-basal body complex protein FliE [Candidatus Kryptonium thompsoni]CUS79732.1 flagellar hook-basal body complex protein FliE [Candidatus Kryptonium thompsoni]CUS82557.1 flagellar hook-basal body complex protei
MLKQVGLIASGEFYKTEVRERAKESVENFESVLKEFIKDVNQLQNEAGEAIEKAITGEISDIHDVMIAVEKAKTSFELLMEVRNKMLEAYKELMRLQV